MNSPQTILAAENRRSDLPRGEGSFPGRPEPAASVRATRGITQGAKSPSGNAPLAAAPAEFALELGLGLSGASLLAEVIGALFAVGAGVGAALGIGALSGAPRWYRSSPLPWALARRRYRARRWLRRGGVVRAKCGRTVRWPVPERRSLHSCKPPYARQSHQAHCCLLICAQRAGEYFSPDQTSNFRAPASREPCNTPTKRDGFDVYRRKCTFCWLNFDS
jgi:hypothetical protein